MNRVHVNHQVDAELCFAVMLDPVDEVMGAFDVAAAVHLGMDGGHVLVRTVVMDDQVMTSEDARIALDEIDDGIKELRIDGVADQRCQGLPCDADTVPEDDQGDEEADIGIDVPVEEMENQEGREGRCRRQDIHEGILARRTVDVRIDFLCDATVEQREAELRQHGNEQDHGGIDAVVHHLRMQDLPEGVLQGAEADVQYQDRDDEGRDVLDTPVPEGVVLVGFLSGHLRTDHGDHGAAGVGQVVKAVGHDRHGVDDDADGNFEYKKEQVAYDSRQTCSLRYFRSFSMFVHIRLC